MELDKNGQKSLSLSPQTNLQEIKNLLHDCRIPKDSTYLNVIRESNEFCLEQLMESLLVEKNEKRLESSMQQDTGYDGIKNEVISLLRRKIDKE